jgi:hypothetical protein
MPSYLTLAAAVLFAAALLAIQPYSVSSPWHVYDRPARLYLEAAAQGDSLTLTHRTSTAVAVRWALAAGQAQPDSLAHWAREAEAWTGNQHGETTEVFLRTPSSNCDLVLRFVGAGRSAKVEQASSACFDPR